MYTYAEMLEKTFDAEERDEGIRKNIIDFLTLSDDDIFYSTTDLARHLLAGSGSSMDRLDALTKCIMALRKKNTTLENYGFVTPAKKKKLMYGKLSTVYLWKNPKTTYGGQVANAEEPTFIPQTSADVAVLSLTERVSELESAVKDLRDLMGVTVTNVQVDEEELVPAIYGKGPAAALIEETADIDDKDESVSDIAKAFAKEGSISGVDSGGYAGQNDVTQKPIGEDE